MVVDTFYRYEIIGVVIFGFSLKSEVITVTFRDVQVRVFSYRSGLHRLMSSEINTGQVFHRLKRSKIFNRSGLHRLMRSNIFNRSGLHRLMRSEVFNRPSPSKVRDGAGQRFLRVQLCEVREVNRTECRS